MIEPGNVIRKRITTPFSIFIKSQLRNLNNFFISFRYHKT